MAASVTDRQDSREKLLNAALSVVRTKGYSPARVEDICEAAGVTKGSFFHHFKSKEDLALAAVQHWEDITGGLFATAPYHEHADPLERLLAYVAFRRELLRGSPAEFTCFAGTIIQEAYQTHPEVRAACTRNVEGHAATLEADIRAAMEQYGCSGDWTAASLALYTQAVLQGAFVLAKAQGGPEVARQSLDHLRRYLELLFTGKEGTKPGKHEQSGTDTRKHDRQDQSRPAKRAGQRPRPKTNDAKGKTGPRQARGKRK